ncbi:MAG: response regulator transcription factor [Verrucomicrobiota bacterium]
MKARVLLIEDDESLRRGLADNLLAQGWEVKAVADGDAGLEAALSWKADVILLDIMLPGVNGYEICRSLRLEQIETPVVMLTARGQTEDVVRGLELGADDYVVKPFALAELLARVKRLLKGRGGEEARYELGGGMVLDVEGRRVEGLKEELAPKEFGVLEFLVRNEGRALPRTRILQEVWGPGLFVTERSVDRAVKVLRAKLGKTGKGIETVRGVGYRWGG